MESLLKNCRNALVSVCVYEIMGCVELNLKDTSCDTLHKRVMFIGCSRTVSPMKDSYGDNQP